MKKTNKTQTPKNKSKKAVSKKPAKKPATKKTTTKKVTTAKKGTKKQTPKKKYTSKQKKPPKRKNVSQIIPNGRTLQTRDEFLKGGSGKENIKEDHPDKRDLYRRVGVIDSNRDNEVVVVKLSTKGRHDLKSYLSGKTKYNAFVEIEDNNGQRIKIDNVRFYENPPYRDLSIQEVNQIKKNCYSNKKTSKSLRDKNINLTRQVKNRQ